jgi:hypothetical protein
MPLRDKGGNQACGAARKQIDEQFSYISFLALSGAGERSGSSRTIQPRGNRYRFLRDLKTDRAGPAKEPAPRVLPLLISSRDKVTHPWRKENTKDENSIAGIARDSKRIGSQPSQAGASSCKTVGWTTTTSDQPIHIINQLRAEKLPAFASIVKRYLLCRASSETTAMK